MRLAPGGGEGGRNLDAGRQRQSRRSCRGEAGEGAERSADRAIRMMMAAMRIGFVRGGVVTPGQQRQHAPLETVPAELGGMMARTGLERLGEIKGEMDRDQGIEPQRDHAEPCRDGSEPQSPWPHLIAPRAPQPQARPDSTLDAGHRLVHQSRLLRLGPLIP
jgi:hypothetical protein